MATAARADLPVEDNEFMEARYADLAGWTIGFERYKIDADAEPAFAGLPDGACQTPHWGVVLAGQVTMRYTDGTQEVLREGDAYAVRPGHVPLVSAGTDLIEFSPTESFQQTMAAVAEFVAGLSAAGTTS